jgi:hypothetical protein
MGGAGLPFGLILIGAFVVVALVGIYVFAPWWRKEEEERERLLDPRTESLIYEVPEGRDPAPVVAALRNDGLQAVELMRHGRQQVLISCAGDKEQLRSRARAVIAHDADLNFEGDPSRVPVTFTDE